jgi:hypothetical protein
MPGAQREMKIHRIGNKRELYKVADSFFLRSSEEAREYLLEALENNPDILDELADFILMNAETPAYHQNLAFRQLLSLLENGNDQL